MHVETDRLTYLKDDWKNQFPISELKVITAPKPQISIFDQFGDETNVIIEIAEDLNRPISGGLVKQTNVCTETFGEKFEPLVPARWEGMAMGCNCTGTEQDQ